ncbi:hypothetical protein C3L33_14886, partial [Rhododendron williamsianum]
MGIVISTQRNWERGTMTTLLDIQPCELKFSFELKKQSSCAIQLINTSDHYVAFKSLNHLLGEHILMEVYVIGKSYWQVKTTSPKKYCVRPNNGIIKPKSKCDFTGSTSAPSDLQCRDKFLVQSTVFAKDNGKNIEESKLRVVLISPPQSPVLLQSNGVTKQELPHETSGQKDKLWTGVENLPPPMCHFRTDVDDDVMEESWLLKDEVDLSPSKGAKPRPTLLKLGKDIEELKSKINVLESRLSEVSLSFKTVLLLLVSFRDEGFRCDRAFF